MIASMRLLIGSFVLKVVSGLILDVLVLRDPRRPRGLLLVRVGTTDYRRRACFFPRECYVSWHLHAHAVLFSVWRTFRFAPAPQCLPRRVLGLLVLGVEFPLALRWFPVEDAEPVVR